MLTARVQLRDGHDGPPYYVPGTWVHVPYVDQRECCCAHRSDAAGEIACTNGPRFCPGGTMCPRCQDSWDGHWLVQPPAKVHLDPAAIGRVRARREALGLRWFDLYTATRIAMGTLTSLGRGSHARRTGKHFPALDFRRLVIALDATPQAVLGQPVPLPGPLLARPDEY